MYGLSAIGPGRAYAYPFSSVRQQAASRGTEAVGAVAPLQTAPVPPVTGVAAVQRGSAQSVPLNEIQLPTRREGADPVEMAVRGRIQYLYQEEDGAQDTPELQDARSPQEVMEEGECQTCKERKYQDGSDDPSVSYQTPTNIAPELAASAVRGHEQEHVGREQAKARRENREVVSQSVALHTAICPECGRVYISGGTTRTTTRASDTARLFQQPEEQPSLFQATA